MGEVDLVRHTRIQLCVRSHEGSHRLPSRGHRARRVHHARDHRLLWRHDLVHVGRALSWLVDDDEVQLTIELVGTSARVALHYQRDDAVTGRIDWRDRRPELASGLGRVADIFVVPRHRCRLVPGGDRNHYNARLEPYGRLTEPTDAYACSDRRLSDAAQSEDSIRRLDPQPVVSLDPEVGAPNVFTCSADRERAVAYRPLLVRDGQLDDAAEVLIQILRGLERADVTAGTVSDAHAEIARGNRRTARLLQRHRVGEVKDESLSRGGSIDEHGGHAIEVRAIPMCLVDRPRLQPMASNDGSYLAGVRHRTQRRLHPAGAKVVVPRHVLERIEDHTDGNQYVARSVGGSRCAQLGQHVRCGGRPLGGRYADDRLHHRARIGVATEARVLVRIPRLPSARRQHACEAEAIRSHRVDRAREDNAGRNRDVDAEPVDHRNRLLVDVEIDELRGRRRVVGGDLRTEQRVLLNEVTACVCRRVDLHVDEHESMKAIRALPRRRSVDGAVVMRRVVVHRGRIGEELTQQVDPGKVEVTDGGPLLPS